MKVLEVEGWRGTLEHPEGWTETLNSLLCWDCQEVQDILLKGRTSPEPGGSTSFEWDTRALCRQMSKRVSKYVNRG